MSRENTDKMFETHIFKQNAISGEIFPGQMEQHKQSRGSQLQRESGRERELGHREIPHPNTQESHQCQSKHDLDINWNKLTKAGERK